MIKISRIKIPLAILLISAFILSGCSEGRRAVPQALADKAEVPGMPGVRSNCDSTNPLMEKSLLESFKYEYPTYFPSDADGVKTYSSLAISGGADNGAYGAGVLKGWSEAGSRPVFKVVTGVSTGALIAPYAFLGSEYDKEVETLFTNISTDDIVKRKGFLSGVFGNSLTSSEPLARLISASVNDRLLSDIAREYGRGRRLFVGTVNLDACKLIIWDMGAIAVLASRGNLQARELFKKVLLASASIPVTFSPVLIDVEADGKMYKEMHVDGGTLSQVFFIYGLAHNLRKMAGKAGVDISKVKAKLYVIRNGKVTPGYKEMKSWLGAIAERSIDAMTGAQTVGDIYRLYAISVEKGNDFNLAYIPDNYVSGKKEFFDKYEMRRLFERGYQDALKGYSWHKTPPGWEKTLAGEE
ncbi:MAG: patatin-like phospholipase family protein [Candidatus Omnitrophica bacterium]|nr:patatin-like phospholipase family protein [Candidatus Omnitrophota bacterium]